jgi:hypothetical protein
MGLTAFRRHKIEAAISATQAEAAASFSVEPQADPVEDRQPKRQPRRRRLIAKEQDGH